MAYVRTVVDHAPAQLKYMHKIYPWQFYCIGIATFIGGSVLKKILYPTMNKKDMSRRRFFCSAIELTWA